MFSLYYVFSEFRKGHTPILIATDVAARGLGLYLVCATGPKYNGLVPMAVKPALPLECKECMCLFSMALKT